MYWSILSVFCDYLDSHCIGTEYQILRNASQHTCLPIPQTTLDESVVPLDNAAREAALDWPIFFDKYFVLDAPMRLEAFRHAISQRDLIGLKVRNIPRAFTTSAPRFSACLDPLHLRAEGIGIAAVQGLEQHAPRASRWVYCRPEFENKLARLRDDHHAHSSCLGGNHNATMISPLESALMLGDFWWENKQWLTRPGGRYLLKLNDSSAYAECMPYMSWHEAGRTIKLRSIWANHSPTETSDLTAFTFLAFTLPRCVAAKALRQIQRFERGSKSDRERIIRDLIVPHCPSVAERPNYCHLFFS